MWRSSIIIAILGVLGSAFGYFFGRSQRLRKFCVDMAVKSLPSNDEYGNINRVEIAERANIFEYFIKTGDVPKKGAYLKKIDNDVEDLQKKEVVMADRIEKLEKRIGKLELNARFPRWVIWVWLIAIVAIGLSLISIFFSVAPNTKWNVEIVSTSIILAFVGVLATFVVVSNYMQLKRTEDRVEALQTQLGSQSEKLINLETSNKTLSDNFSKTKNIIYATVANVFLEMFFIKNAEKDELSFLFLLQYTSLSSCVKDNITELFVPEYLRRTVKLLNGISIKDKHVIKSALKCIKKIRKNGFECTELDEIETILNKNAPTTSDDGTKETTGDDEISK